MRPTRRAESTRKLATNPGMPVLVWLLPILAGMISPWEALAWIGFGGGAGYALSGSV